MPKTQKVVLQLVKVNEDEDNNKYIFVTNVTDKEWKQLAREVQELITKAPYWKEA